MIDAKRNTLGRALEVVPGWLSEEEGKALYSLARECGGDAVEIGSMCGRSSLCIAAGLHDDAWLDCVDPWDLEWSSLDPSWTVGPSPYMTEMMTIKDVFNFATRRLNITSHNMLSSTYFIDLDHQVSMVFIDGDHTYEGVRADIMLALAADIDRIALHDYGDSTHIGVKRAADELLGGPRGVYGSVAIYRR